MAEDIRARQWASQRGCYVHPNVALQLGDDGMGLYAQGKIETGEPIIKVPIECCVTTESAESALSDAGVAVSGLDPMTLLRLAVCLARQHACHAPWDAMAREWSRFDAIPSTWSPAMVDLLLTGTSIHTAVQAKQRALSKEGAALRKRAPIRNWSEADAIVRSRVMPLPDRGFALVPLLDYANHSDNANARWDVEMVTETADVDQTNPDSEHTGAMVHLISTRRIADAEQICINYGPDKGAGEFLYTYGFVPPREVTREMRVGPMTLLSDHGGNCAVESALDELQLQQVADGLVDAYGRIAGIDGPAAAAATALIEQEGGLVAAVLDSLQM